MIKGVGTDAPVVTNEKGGETMRDTLKDTIKWYLETYWGVVVTISKERGDVIFKGVMKDLEVNIQTSILSDTTAMKGIKLASLNIDKDMKWIKVINKAYEYFKENDPAKAELMRLSFLEKNSELKTVYDIADALFISRQTYYNWIDDIYLKIGTLAVEKELADIQDIAS